ncbi:MAG TPA: PHP domain-containing protein [Chloroflexi bacterium]|nr:PHP domain-containing protein [Chloroflexota bacterium]
MTSSTWSKADLHIHSLYSDGAHDIPTILAHVAEHTDLRVIAITDHDCIASAYEAHFLAPRYGIEVVVGQEITTNRGHLLGLFINEQVPRGLSIPEAVDAVHVQGGLAVLAHPFDRIADSPMRHRPYPTADEWLGYNLDGLEAMNGCQLDPKANPRAHMLATLLGLPTLGGSDAHHRQVIGVSHTRFPGETAADLFKAIRQGTCEPAGRGWSRSEYLGWVLKSFIPRIVGLRRSIPVPSMNTGEAARVTVL